MTDEELIRAILSDRAATPREKGLAKRMDRLLYSFDNIEEIYEDIYIERVVIQ